MTFFGLSEREAEASRKKYGFNELLYKPSFGRNLLRGLNGLSCKLFVIAALAEIIRSLLVLNGFTNAETDFIRPVVLFGAGVLCGLAEAALRQRSERIVNGLCGFDGDAEYTVFRNSGRTERVPRRMLSVGDAVFLSEGDVVPADGTMADGMRAVDQSVFGDVGKAEKTVPPDSYRKGSIAGTNDPYAVYSGTLVCGGSGIVKITSIGENTETARKNEPKRMELHLDGGSRFDGMLRTSGAAGSTAALAALVFGTVSGVSSGQLYGGLARGVSIAAAVLAVACFCGKNLLSECTAASAVKRLSKKGVRVSDPGAVCRSSDIGMAVIERGGMIAGAEYSADGTVFIDGGGKEYGGFGSIGAGLSEILKNAVICTSAAAIAPGGSALGGSPLDRALYRFLGRKAEKAPDYKRQTEVKSDGGSVLSGVTVSAGGRLFTFVRGGAEILLERCSDSIGADGRKQRITNKSALQKLAATISLTGKDVIAFAVSERGIKEGRLPSGGYSLIGLVALYDGFFAEAADEVKHLEGLGVRVVLASEESRETALFAAKYAGISGVKGSAKKSAGVVLSSDQLAKMSDKELSGKLKDIKAIVRAAPSDRRRLIRAAHENGIKVCVSSAGLRNLKAASEADLTVASHGCSTAVRAGSDAAASEEKCGIKALADIIACSAEYAAKCKVRIAFRAVCAVAAAAAAVMFFI